MTGWSRRKYKGTQYADYICKTHKTNKEICNTKNINRLYIEEVVLTLLCSITNNLIRTYNNKLISYVGEKTIKLKNEVLSITNEINSKENQIRKLVDRIIIDEENEKYYTDKLTLIKSEMLLLKNKLTNIENLNITRINEINNKINNFIINKELLTLNPSILRNLLIETIHKIEVSNEVIKIYIKDKK